MIADCRNIFTSKLDPELEREPRSSRRLSPDSRPPHVVERELPRPRRLPRGSALIAAQAPPDDEGEE